MTPENPEITGATCDRPGNSFTSAASLARLPHGERLDYLFFGSNSGARIDCSECRLALGKVPGVEYNYSDHEAVEADFTLQRNVTGESSP